MTTATIIRPQRIHGAGLIPRGTCLGKQNPHCTANLHGTHSAYRAGCRCPHAREANRVYRKRHRENRDVTRFVDSTGTRRRLRALSALGWRWQDMAEHLGSTGQNIQNFVLRERGDQVTVVTAERVKVLYDRLSATPGPSEITRKRATRKGWAPPLAWDEATIDDPDAQPVVDDEASETDTFDPLTVALAVDGRLTHAQLIHHRPDLIEVVRRLAQRMTDVEIAHHLHWPGCDDGPPGKTRGQNAVGKLRNREGIPGPERYEAVYAYRPGGRRARNDKAA